MLKDSKVLAQYLEDQLGKIASDNEKCKLIYKYSYETYEIPKGITMDLITKRMSMSEATEFMLFILLDALNNIENRSKLTLDKFYTEKEIKFYKKSKYKVETVKFPLVFKAIQVTDDQWISTISISELMKLRQAQLINYNTNAQRTLQKVVRGGKETYRITLNQKAVEEISNNYANNTFIPNTITLNIPEECESDFYYDSENCTLTIKALEHFDVTDGFHRYIAASREKDRNPDFDYLMELRIVNWSEDKAKQFIYQEDQKTKMRKVDSESMNMDRAANMVVTRLNESVRCNLKGLISRNDGLINFSDLAALVDYFYFKKALKSRERTIMIKAVAELTENFNLLTEYNTRYLEEKMSYSTLLAAMFCFDYFRDKDKSKMCEVIEATASVIDASNNAKFKNKTPRKNVIAEVENIVKGVM